MSNCQLCYCSVLLGINLQLPCITFLHGCCSEIYIELHLDLKQKDGSLIGLLAIFLFMSCYGYLKCKIFCFLPGVIESQRLRQNRCSGFLFAEYFSSFDTEYLCAIHSLVTATYMEGNKLMQTSHSFQLKAIRAHTLYQKPITYSCSDHIRSDIH